MGDGSGVEGLWVWAGGRTRASGVQGGHEASPGGARGAVKLQPDRRMLCHVMKVMRPSRPLTSRRARTHGRCHRSAPPAAGACAHRVSTRGRRPACRGQAHAHASRDAAGQPAWDPRLPRPPTCPPTRPSPYLSSGAVQVAAANEERDVAQQRPGGGRGREPPALRPLPSCSQHHRHTTRSRGGDA